MTADRYRIFVSHYSEEKPIAQAVRDLLDHAYAGHAKVFISADIRAGNDWLMDIKEALVQSDEILTVFTFKSADRPWVNIETGFGNISGKPVTPILFSGFTLLDLPDVYHTRQSVNSRDQGAVVGLFNDILARMQGKTSHARTTSTQDRFWKTWSDRIPKAEALSPENPIRSNDTPVVWLIGSLGFTHDEHLQQKCLQVCQTIAREFMANGIQIVMGTSRMLEYLGDCAADFMDSPQQLADAKGEPWRKTIATEHAQSTSPAPNPIVLLGNLRQRSPRELFDDAIGRFPDIAIIIGGRETDDEGRAPAEIELANAAQIPILPLMFTGGAAARLTATTDHTLASRVDRIQKLKANIDELGPAVREVVQCQAAIQSTKFTPRGR